MDLTAAVPRFGVVMVLAGAVVAWRGIPEATAVGHAADAQPTAQAVPIAGVVASADGTPLAGALVEGCGTQTATGSDGSYLLETAADLPCVVTARFGQRVSEQTVAPAQRNGSSVDFTLASATAPPAL